jgi:hypothetical protein
LAAGGGVTAAGGATGAGFDGLELGFLGMLVYWVVGPGGACLCSRRGGDIPA